MEHVLLAWKDEKKHSVYLSAQKKKEEKCDQPKWTWWGVMEILPFRLHMPLFNCNFHLFRVRPIYRSKGDTQNDRYQQKRMQLQRKRFEISNDA